MYLNYFYLYKIFNLIIFNFNKLCVRVRVIVVIIIMKLFDKIIFSYNVRCIDN